MLEPQAPAVRAVRLPAQWVRKIIFSADFQIQSTIRRGELSPNWPPCEHDFNVAEQEDYVEEFAAHVS